MLFEDLYTIEEKEGDELGSQFIFKLKINKNHKIFEGHFPAQPVLPGVCQIEMVKELLNNVMKSEVMLASASNIKYIDIVDPNKNEFVYLKLNIDKQTENIKVSAVSSFESGEPNFKFSGLFRST